MLFLRVVVTFTPVNPLRWLGLPLGNIPWYPEWIQWLFGRREVVAMM